MVNFAPRALRAALGYRKFASPPTRVVLFDSGYHVQAQLGAALRRMGHHVVSIHIGAPGASTTAEVSQTLIQTLLTHRPDFVLSVNQIGFDTQGIIGNLLDTLQIPVAVWYVDCPFLAHDGHILAAPRMTTVFVWEREMIPLLYDLGVERVHYLPLGCDTTLFNSLDKVPATQAVGFVGNSMDTPMKRWDVRLTPFERRTAQVLRETLLMAPEQFTRLLGKPRPAPDRRMTQLAWATYAATASYRNTMLAGLNNHDLHLTGDDAWESIVPKATHHPMVPYGNALCRTYHRAAVNLNFTSLQMPSAVNQRVFDVPASGAFLLSDAQRDISELFDPDSIATFDGPEALQEKIDFFTRNEAQRHRFIRRAHAQVMARHTYEHRMTKLIAETAAAAAES